MSYRKCPCQKMRIFFCVIYEVLKMEVRNFYIKSFRLGN